MKNPDQDRDRKDSLERPDDRFIHLGGGIYEGGSRQLTRLFHDRSAGRPNSAFSEDGVRIFVLVSQGVRSADSHFVWNVLGSPAPNTFGAVHRMDFATNGFGAKFRLKGPQGV